MKIIMLLILIKLLVLITRYSKYKNGGETSLIKYKSKNKNSNN